MCEDADSDGANTGEATHTIHSQENTVFLEAQGRLSATEDAMPNQTLHLVRMSYWLCEKENLTMKLKTLERPSDISHVLVIHTPPHSERERKEEQHTEKSEEG